MKSRHRYLAIDNIEQIGNMPESSAIALRRSQVLYQEQQPATAHLPLPVLLNPPVMAIAANAPLDEQRIYDPVTQTGANYPLMAGTSHPTCYYAGGVDWGYNDTWDDPY
jgi:hypothetical protein